jgi:tyrosine aminotransferase
MGLWMSLNVLCDEGDNFLMPKPGFPLIVAMAENRKIQIKYYELDENSEIKKETLCPDEKTKFLLVNNPSNPLGSNWSR